MAKLSVVAVTSLLMLVVFWMMFFSFSPNGDAVTIQAPSPAPSRQPLPKTATRSAAAENSPAHRPKHAENRIIEPTSPPSVIDISPPPETSAPSHHQQQHHFHHPSRPNIFIISFADSAATAGMMYAAMTRLCYSHMNNYRAVLYTEEDFAEYMPKKPTELVNLEAEVAEKLAASSAKKKKSQKGTVVTTTTTTTTVPLQQQAATHSTIRSSGSSSSSSKVKVVPLADQLKRLKRLLDTYNGNVRKSKFWSKTHLMERALTTLVKSDRDWVFWMDSDVVVTNPNITLESVIGRVMKWRKPSKNVAFHRRKRREKERKDHENRPEFRVAQALEKVREARRKTREAWNAGRWQDPGSKVADSLNNRTKTKTRSNSSSSKNSTKTLKRGRLIRSQNVSAWVQAYENTEYDPDRPRLPDMIISDSTAPVNNGVFGMRRTNWSFQFLYEWRRDHASNYNYLDNGPFLHTLLRSLARSRGITYKNECHQDTMIKELHAKIKSEYQEKLAAAGGKNRSSFATGNKSSHQQQQQQLATDAAAVASANSSSTNAEELDLRDLLLSLSVQDAEKKSSSSSSSITNKTSNTSSSLQPPKYPNVVPMADFKRCYEKYLGEVVADGNREEFVSRCPYSTAPVYEIAYRDVNETYKSARGKNWEFGWLMRDDPHIGGDCRINAGFSAKYWNPSGVWSENSLTVHTAGYRNKTIRSAMLSQHSIKSRNKFSPPCF